MMVSGPAIGGNLFPKYTTRNPVARMLVSRFTKTVLSCVDATFATTVLDIGCGEGYFSRQFAAKGLKVRGVDISPDIIEVARGLAPEGLVIHETRALDDLDPARDKADLVTLLEVLEHIENPDAALARVAALADPFVILTVPREPLWRALNMARGAYLRDWGNTPGHVNHWSADGFRRFVATKFQVIKVLNPLPWTVVLARV